MLLEVAQKDESIIARINRDKRRVHMAYSRLSMIRVSLTKHETRGKKNSIANTPGYGRLNMSCGSLDYELETGRFVLGTISRRDIADSLRALAANEDPQDDSTLAQFDAAMRGPSRDEEVAMTKQFSDFSGKSDA